MSIPLVAFLGLLIPMMSHLVVKSPKELAAQFENQTMLIGLSNFGMIPYGHTIVGKVFFDEEPKYNQTLGCNKLDRLTIPDQPKVDESPMIVIERGNCSFVTKVRNVENAHGHVAIIINTEAEDVTQVVMADDGRGMELSIPGVIISKDDGKKLKDFLLSNQDNPELLKKIVFEIEFEMENRNNTVEYDIWYTPDQEQIYRLMGDFYAYHIMLGEYAKLNMHIVTYPHYAYDQNKKGAKEHCLSNGQYCVRPGNLGIKDGSDVVKEAIKQKCIYNYAYGNNKPELFWRYMQFFYYSCIVEKKFDQTCSNYASKLAYLPVDQINLCYSESYDATPSQRQEAHYEKVTPNKLLEAENKQRQTWLISKVPSLFVNRRLFLSSWRADYVFEGICAGLLKKPEVCYMDGYFAKEKKMSFYTIFYVVLLILAINFAIFYFCAKMIKKKIQERIDSSNMDRKIDTVVHSYLAMKETKE